MLVKAEAPVALQPEAVPVVHPKNYQWIDALRGVAILLVITAHVFSAAPVHHRGISMLLYCGQFGVQLFFLLSAITLCLSQKARENEAGGIGNFYIRRYFRIAPCYYMGIGLYLFSSALQNYLHTHNFVPEYHYTVETVLENILLIHGFFPFANNRVVPGGWSIGTEVIFYLMFPLIWQLQKRLKFNRLMLLAGVSIVLALLFMYCESKWLGLLTTNNSFLYFSIVNQFPVFLLGIMVYRNFTYRSSMIVSFCWSAVFAVLILLLFPKNNWIATVAMPFFAGCMFVGLIEVCKNVRMELIPKWLAAIGKVSFSVYIFHFVVLNVEEYLLRQAMPRFMDGYFGGLVLWAMVVLVTFAIAKLSYKYIERYFIGIGERIIIKRNLALS